MAANSRPNLRVRTSAENLQDTMSSLKCYLKNMRFTGFEKNKFRPQFPNHIKSPIFLGVSIKHPFWVSPNLLLICVAKEERCISNAKLALPGNRSPDRRAPWKGSTVKNTGIIEFRFRMNKGSYNINIIVIIVTLVILIVIVL